MTKRNEAIAILTGGGPAPGMNTVVGSVAKTFLQKGYSVIGLHKGFTGLFREAPATENITFLKADEIFNLAGSFLRMSRFKPSDEDFEKRFNWQFFTENNIKLLVTIGGDDTASTANRVAKFLEEKRHPIANIHVPKTIDNDLPLPDCAPTFGYESAKDKGAVIARAVYVDARTSGNWFVMSAMGRSAGHLAFGIGEACHYPMIVIPEMFNKTPITIDKIIRLMVSSIVKRRIVSMDYGAAVISEGVFHELSEAELSSCGIHFTYDAHGHPELGKVSKACFFSMLLDQRLAELKLNVQTPPRGVGLRNPGADAGGIRPDVLLGAGYRRLQALQRRQDGLHGLCGRLRQRRTPLPERPARPRDGQDPAPHGGHLVRPLQSRSR